MHPQPESLIQPTQAVQAPPESGDTSMDPQGLPNPTSTAAGVLRHNSEVTNNDLSTEVDENGSEQDYPSDGSMSPSPTTSHPPHPNGFNSPIAQDRESIASPIPGRGFMSPMGRARTSAPNTIPSSLATTNGSQLMSAEPPSSTGPGPRVNGVGSFQTDFINSVASGLDDFDASMFRPDGDINFERDFGQWFRGEDSTNGSS